MGTITIGPVVENHISFEMAEHRMHNVEPRTLRCP